MSALEAAKNGVFRSKKKMSTVTKIELVPRDSFKNAARADHGDAKRSVADLSHPMQVYR